MEHNNYEKDLQHIRRMMEKSSRFISLNGMAGVFAGMLALLGSGYIYTVLRNSGISLNETEGVVDPNGAILEITGTALLMMIMAILGAVFLTVKRSRKLQLKVWDGTTRKMLFHFGVPLAAGGLFCLALLLQGRYMLLAPSTLVFYGLALFMAGNYTFSDIKYLGLSEIALGLAAVYFPEHGLLLWAVGFGVMHVVYGLVMYRKYN